MGKLIVYYGVMGSSKSLRLLIQRYDLMFLNKKVLTGKPALDTRSSKIMSRIGIEHFPEGSIEELINICKDTDVDYLLIDEAQFLSSDNVRDIRELTVNKPLICVCYMLKTDFKGKLFKGSKRLLELADVIEEIPTVCKRCDEKAIFNMRIDKDGKKVMDGEVVQIGGDESYIGVCSYHYNE